MIGRSSPLNVLVMCCAKLGILSYEDVRRCHSLQFFARAKNRGSSAVCQIRHPGKPGHLDVERSEDRRDLTCVESHQYRQQRSQLLSTLTCTTKIALA